MARRKTTHEKWVMWPLLLMEVLGFCVAFYLLLISARVISPTTLPCPVNGIFACASIIRGKFSYIGPFSIAALGVIYFVAQLSLTAITRLGNWAACIKGLMILSGFLFLGWLRATEIVYLHKICPWCYAVCILTLVEAVLVWPAITPFVPKWGIGQRVLTVFGLFFLTCLVLCVPVYLLKSPENCFGRQYFPFDYAKIADGGQPIEHEIDLLPTNKQQAVKQKPVPIFTPNPQNTIAPSTQKTADKPQIIMDESSRDSDETRILRSRGWRVLANHESVKNAIKSNSPVLLLAFDPICDECSYLITKQLSNPITEDIPAFRIAVDYQQLRGDLAIAVDGVPMMLLIDNEGNVLWKHKGRKDATSLVREIRQVLNK